MFLLQAAVNLVSTEENAVAALVSENTVDLSVLAGNTTKGPEHGTLAEIQW